MLGSATRARTRSIPATPSRASRRRSRPGATIELDVLRPPGDFADGGNWRNAAAGPGQGVGPLLVAHDWATPGAGSAEPRGGPDAFAAPPLDHIRFDLDLKIAGREDEVIAALRERNLIERAMVSTMEADSLAYLRDAAPDLDRGWTPWKVSRDWSRNRWLRPVFLAGSASLRARLPAIIRRGAPAARRVGDLGLSPADHAPAGRRRARRRRRRGRLDRRRARARGAPRGLGVDGICSNDPRLLAEL